MKPSVSVKYAKIQGKRVNLTPESDIPEEVKIAAVEAKQADRTRKNGRTLAVWAAVLVGLPFVLPLVFFINGALTNHALPIGVYPYLVMIFCIFAEVGGLILYIASRNANYLRKPIGWTALAIFIFHVTATAVFQNYLVRFDSTKLNHPSGFVVFVMLLLMLLCMLALCVFAVLMLKRVFPKQSKPKSEA